MIAAAKSTPDRQTAQVEHDQLVSKALVEWKNGESCIVYITACVPETSATRVTKAPLVRMRPRRGSYSIYHHGSMIDDIFFCEFGKKAPLIKSCKKKKKPPLRSLRYT